ncbi:uncharacterized protein LOC116167390 [Photinus pyralis]|nr:uncharacterized protein LOC116167327 [Photinus pyralis]XP_031338604.1 uncharacterized protein LOC116167390 [Photinus pyralis]
MELTHLAFVIIILRFQTSSPQGTQGVTFPNAVQFPFGGPFMGLFLAIAIPLELPKTNVYLSYNFEANYNIPENETTYDYPPIISDRSLGINRKNVYDALEFKINSHGYPGKECLLRTICEVSEYDLSGNGVLGDIVHVILSPTSSKNENLSPEYEEAEKDGKSSHNCEKYSKSCPVSLIGLISWLENADFD